MVPLPIEKYSYQPMTLKISTECLKEQMKRWTDDSQVSSLLFYLIIEVLYFVNESFRRQQTMDLLFV